MIAQLLAAEEVPSQDRLRALLADRGLEATQATLSRDLREMGVVKGPRGYTLSDPWSQPESRPSNHHPDDQRAVRALNRVLSASILSAEQAGTLVVLKTPPGHAQLVAVELDRRPPTGVVGTVGGDDTIFVACSSTDAAKTLLGQLREASGFVTGDDQ